MLRRKPYIPRVFNFENEVGRGSARRQRNAGHTCGDALTDPQRADLLEYLRSL